MYSNCQFMPQLNLPLFIRTYYIGKIIRGMMVLTHWIFLSKRNKAFLFQEISQKGLL